MREHNKYNRNTKPARRVLAAALALLTAVTMTDYSGLVTAAETVSSGDTAETSAEAKTGGQSGTTETFIVTSWEYNDPDKYLTIDETSGAYTLAAGGIDTEEPANNPTQEEIIEILPTSITATLAETETESTGETAAAGENAAEDANEASEVEIELGDWTCDDYPATDAETDALTEAPTETSYTFTASLPEGYALADDAAALTVTLVFDIAELMSDDDSAPITGTYDDISWSLCDGMLNISGNGEIENMFDDATKGSIVTVNIMGDYVTSIGEEAFANCKNLKAINMNSSVESIGNSAFYNCTSLESITITGKITEIGNLAFYNCTSLNNVI